MEPPLTDGAGADPARTSRSTRSAIRCTAASVVIGDEAVRAAIMQGQARRAGGDAAGAARAGSARWAPADQHPDALYASRPAARWRLFRRPRLRGRPADLPRPRRRPRDGAGRARTIVELAREAIASAARTRCSFPAPRCARRRSRPRSKRAIGKPVVTSNHAHRPGRACAICGDAGRARPRTGRLTDRCRCARRRDRRMPMHAPRRYRRRSPARSPARYCGPTPMCPIADPDRRVGRAGSSEARTPADHRQLQAARRDQRGRCPCPRRAPARRGRRLDRQSRARRWPMRRRVRRALRHLHVGAGAREQDRRDPALGAEVRIVGGSQDDAQEEVDRAGRRRGHDHDAALRPSRQSSPGRARSASRSSKQVPGCRRPSWCRCPAAG